MVKGFQNLNAKAQSRQGAQRNLCARLLTNVPPFALSLSKGRTARDLPPAFDK
jgi:hypothetical protein